MLHDRRLTGVVPTPIDYWRTSRGPRVWRFGSAAAEDCVVLAGLFRRLATAAVTLLLVTLLVFCLIHVSPGEPLAGGPEEESLARMSPEALAQLRAQYRLDEPLHRQYLLWLGDLLRADLGRSFHDRPSPYRRRSASAWVSR